MTNAKERGDLLKKFNYVFNFNRGLYINYGTKKILSLQVIEKNSLSWLEYIVSSDTLLDRWQLYTIYPLSDKTKREIMEDVE